MKPTKKPQTKKSIAHKNFHPDSPHNKPYDFDALIASEPALKSFVKQNRYGNLSIDFSDPDAVLMLNRALIRFFYQIDWNIPKGHLCPPVPGRADAIYYLADLLKRSWNGKLPKGKTIRVLDIGAGANMIYPIIGHQLFGWSFTATDIDVGSIDWMKRLIAKNPPLSDAIVCRLQKHRRDIFEGIITKDECFDLTMCNPPFHASKEEAEAGNMKKVQNLTKGRQKSVTLNFGGSANELWCEGGESAFLSTMAAQSKWYAKQVLWFSTLVSKKERLATLYQTLKALNVSKIKTIEMKQGQKITRIVAWTFLSRKEQALWIESSKVRT